MKPKIGIIGGKGRMGQLFKQFFQERGLTVYISDLKTALNKEQLIKKSDIVIVSVPIDKTIPIIQEIIPQLQKHQALMDFTSIKEDSVKAMLKANCEVLGMHPMFGDSNPIPGQTVIFTKTRKSGKWSEWMEKFLKKNNVKIQHLTPREHDKKMTISQAMTHFADITFADSLRRMKMPVKEIFKYSGKASELKIQLAARLIDQSPNLYGNIQIQNSQALSALKEYQKAVNDLIKIVRKKDLTAFTKYFNRIKLFLNLYTEEAFKDSSYLIDRLVEKQLAHSQSTQTTKPHKSDLAVLGPAHTFTDLGADKYLSEKKGISSTKLHSKTQKFYARDIDEIFELVDKNKVAEGIIPIENKLHGTIRETLDNLFQKNVHIISEISIPIHHCLITLPNAKKSDIKRIISHTQALHQCKKYLKKHFPKTDRQSYPSTVAAIEKLVTSNDKSLAVIAPKEAANSYNLRIFAENIEDEKGNETTFIIIKRGSAPTANPPATLSSPKNQLSKTANHVPAPPKTSIAFHFSADSPGSLFTVFKDFALAKINMTKIESRPTKARFGDYIFYLDFEGGLKDPRVSQTLKKIAKKVAKLKILGSY